MRRDIWGPRVAYDAARQFPLHLHIVRRARADEFIEVGKENATTCGGLRLPEAVRHEVKCQGPRSVPASRSKYCPEPSTVIAQRIGDVIRRPEQHMVNAEE